MFQSVSVQYLSAEKLQFKIVSINKAARDTSQLSGVAIAKLDQDPEIDEDDFGEAYAAVQYTYSNWGCVIAILIELGNKDKMTVNEFQCGEFRKSNCPFASISVLHKVR